MSVFKHDNSIAPTYKLEICHEEINIPQRVAKLLWKTNEKPDASVLHGGLTISIDFDLSSGEVKMDTSLGQEPSLVYLRLPISKPANPGNIPSPSYFPSYASLLPEQKYMYLKWLADITAPIDISYVFIYYYGLERHLLCGDIELAVAEIMLLRKHHSNGSFQAYSRQGVISACIRQNRSDLLSNIVHDLKSGYLDNMMIHLYKRLGYGLEDVDLISIASQVGFTNRRYIKSSLEIFRNELNGVLIAKYGHPNFSFERYDIKSLPISHEILFANYSFPDNLRTAQLPNFFEYTVFRNEIKGLLSLAHEQTKEKLARARKKRNE